MSDEFFGGNKFSIFRYGQVVTFLANLSVIVLWLSITRGILGVWSSLWAVERDRQTDRPILKQSL